VTKVAICIPTIPTRNDKLRRAVESVHEQSLPTNVTGLIQIELDTDGEGAAPTRNRAWRNVDNDVEWIAFLDDDDVLRTNHVGACLKHALDTQADLVYPWFNIHDGGGADISQNDPLRVPVDGHYVSPYGVGFNDELRTEIMTRNNFIPVTVLVRRELLADVGGFPRPQTDEWSEDCCEDWGLWRRLLDAGAKFEHLPRRTWIWNWHGKNTSGKPWRRRR
jgi:glycosyltransferase involved in cell wall biosynthesis